MSKQQKQSMNVIDFMVIWFAYIILSVFSAIVAVIERFKGRDRDGGYFYTTTTTTTAWHLDG